MAEIRLIDGNELHGIESLLDTDIIQASKEASWLMSQVLHDIDAMPTIDPETLPIVRELREKLEQTEQELRNVKYCYDIAKNGERQLRRQVNEVTAEWAECVKKLKRVAAELDSYKIFFEDITKCGDCNDCGKSATCEFVPKVGQTTRYNCPLWTGR